MRPPTSRRPSTENITAGSVGAIAAPRSHAIVQPKPNIECAASATSPAVANVPTTPSTEIGTAERRKRRQPTFIPPSNRITISATTPMRSTVLIDSRSPSAGKTSEATAAAIRKIAGAGTGNRSRQAAREQREREADGDDQDDGAEIGDLAHALVLTPSRVVNRLLPCPSGP